MISFHGRMPKQCLSKAGVFQGQRLERHLFKVTEVCEHRRPYLPDMVNTTSGGQQQEDCKADFILDEEASRPFFGLVGL